MVKCKIGINKWCNSKNTKFVQLRSQAAGVYGTNEFKGKKLFLCEECRKANRGGFKIIRSSQVDRKRILKDGW